MLKFEEIYRRAVEHKGGVHTLEQLLPEAGKQKAVARSVRAVSWRK